MAFTWPDAPIDSSRVALCKSLLYYWRQSHLMLRHICNSEDYDLCLYLYKGENMPAEGPLGNFDSLRPYLGQSLRALSTQRVVLEYQIVSTKAALPHQPAAQGYSSVASADVDPQAANQAEMDAIAGQAGDKTLRVTPVQWTLFHAEIAKRLGGTPTATKCYGSNCFALEIGRRELEDLLYLSDDQRRCTTSYEREDMLADLVRTSLNPQLEAGANPLLRSNLIAGFEVAVDDRTGEGMVYVVMPDFQSMWTYLRKEDRVVTVFNTSTAGKRQPPGVYLPFLPDGRAMLQLTLCRLRHGGKGRYSSRYIPMNAVLSAMLPHACRINHSNIYVTAYPDLQQQFQESTHHSYWKNVLKSVSNETTERNQFVVAAHEAANALKFTLAGLEMRTAKARIDEDRQGSLPGDPLLYRSDREDRQRTSFAVAPIIHHFLATFEVTEGMIVQAAKLQDATVSWNSLCALSSAPACPGAQLSTRERMKPWTLTRHFSSLAAAAAKRATSDAFVLPPPPPLSLGCSLTSMSSSRI